MRKKRIMIIGPTHSGKTSLANALNGHVGPARKTQDTIFGKYTIDVPGSYVENRWMYIHLIALAQDASHILLLVDPSQSLEVYSPGFAKVFRCPVTGVISKCDLLKEKADRCYKQLQKSGVMEPYYPISTLTGEGIEALKEFIFRNEK